MKRRLITIITIAAMLITMFPTGIFAADERTEENAAVITTSEEEGNIDPQAGGAEYSVGNVTELEEAFKKIAVASDEEATIILTADLSNESIDGNIGVDGKRITFKSADNGRYKMYVNGLAGDCIFDNVDFAKRDNLAANGYYLELTENFTSEIQNIYGVKNYSSKGMTHDGDITMVLKGGSSSEITGTGSNISLNGNINITIDGHKTESLLGGASTPAGDSPYIDGDITINVISGAVSENLYGGSRGASEATGNEPKVVDVTGDISITIGKDGAEEETAQIGDLWGGGNLCSSKSVNITINDGASVGYGNAFYKWLAAAGEACVVEESVTTTVNGGKVAVLYGGGIGNFQIFGDRYDTPCLIGDETVNSTGEPLPDVVKIIINDGYVNSVCGFAYAFNAIHDDDLSKIYGNVNIEMNGGRTVWVNLSYMYNLTYGDATLVVRDGKTTYGTAVQGDNFGYPLNEIDGYVLGDTNVIFDGYGSKAQDVSTSEFAGIGSIKAVNNVILKNSAYVNGSTQCLLNGVGNLTLEDGTALGILGGGTSKNTVLENCSFGNDTALVMSRNVDTETGSATPAVLSVGGKVTGEAALYTVDPVEWQAGPGNTVTLSTPVKGEVYLRANDRDETVASGEHSTLLTLSNSNAAEPYVEYTTDTEAIGDYTHAWRIAGEPQAETITIAPEDQTIYTGGADGDEENNEFPRAIYLVQNDDGTTTPLNETTFFVNGQEWNNEDHRYPFTVQYKDANNNILADDETSGDFTAEIVPVDGVDTDKITTSDGKKVEFATGVLRIRYVSNYESASENLLTNEALTYTEDNKDTIMAQAEAGGKATALLPEGTEICLNGDKSYPYPVDADSKISLFFDDLLPASADGSSLDFVGEMTERAEALGFDVDGKNAQFKYLDLVDSNNSNAWVSSSAGSEIFWPYPEGCSSADEIQLLHFKGLHREYRMGNDDTALKDLIAQADVENVEIQKTDKGIWFSIPESGFSPFALVWEEKSEPSWPDWPDWPPVGPGDDDDDNDDGDDNDNPPILNTEDHFSYVVGYEDGMVKPQRSITRAEVATIFYRLLEDDVRDDNDTTRNNFSDVTSDSWYNQTVSTLASMGILKGYEDGTFRPNASITRAEFAAIATRFFEETGATYEPGTFTDVTGSEWFAGAIMDAVNLGLIGGYEDGTVRPNNNITRAEACAIVNRTLGRVPDADHLLPADEMTTWPDNPSSAWFYADMQEATNGHEYEWITEDGNKVENWIDLLDKDWNDRSAK